MINIEKSISEKFFFSIYLRSRKQAIKYFVEYITYKNKNPDYDKGLWDEMNNEYINFIESYPNKDSEDMLWK